MSVLRIDSSARMDGSNSRVLTQYLVDQLTAVNNTEKSELINSAYVKQDSINVVQRDVAQQLLPQINAQDLVDLHGSNVSDRDSLQQHISLSNELVAELMATDDLVIGAPIYNFSVPAVLKQWIDYVCRAGVTFKYGDNGPVGLTGIKRAFIVTAAGGVPVGGSMDFASGYLEQICRFIGVEDVIHIDASGSKRTPELIVTQGKRQIDEALSAA